MKINLIWAQDLSGGIGKKGDLPWRIPEDLKNFKKITLGKPIVMGLNTWISLPSKPLPRRRNIVIAPEKLAEIETYTSIEGCINYLKDDGVGEIFIVGGGMIYGQFYPHASELHITLVLEDTPGIDTWFPIKMDQIKAEFRMVDEWDITETAKYTRWSRNL
ncbi:MAG: dihydrofolate reductase [FCB group bacterium]|nr:dihydrofolate reductase [FCB group bacterium]